MDKKPFHVMRLKKALNRHTTNKSQPSDAKHKPSVTTTPSNLSASASTGQSASTGYTINVGGVNIEPNHRSIDAIAKKLVPQASAVSVVGTTSSQTLGSSLSSSSGAKTAGDGIKPKTFFLPPYLQDESEGQNFDELIDDQTPVQKTLAPSPFQPSMWDQGRKELIRKYATIYGKNFNRRQKELLTPFEEQVNEGAYQLCLRDPTLLVRREELFLLSKRAVKEGGYTYYYGFPKSKEMENTIATTGQKRPRPRSGSHFDVQPSKILVTTELDVPKKMSGRMRQERMLELEKMIAANKLQQEAKLAELEQAQQLCNFSSAFSIQLEVESLGNACQTLQTSYAAIKRKQRRSDRYYTMKERENEDSEPSKEEVVHSPTNDITTPAAAPMVANQSSKRTGVTATIIPVSQCPGAQIKQPSNFDDSPPEGEDSEVQDLVKNVSHATDEVNSLMIREFQKQLAWDL